MGDQAMSLEYEHSVLARGAPFRRSLKRKMAVFAGALVIMVAAAACGGASNSGGGSGPATEVSNVRSLAGTTITLEGPNQWTQSGSSFGAPWNQLVANFKKATGITVNTDVLPLASFSQTEATQLAAGTAPALVFNQATYQPYMVVHLQNYLKQPNPFVPGNKTWLSEFNSKYYGPNIASVVDPDGNLDYIPLNLVGIGLFYNKQAFAKAGVQAPISTVSDLMSACSKLKAAGYIPLAGDDSVINVAWPTSVLFSMLTTTQQASWNHFTASGAVGSNPTITTKDLTWAIATGKLKATQPQTTAFLTTMKQLFQNCVTPDWSGVTGLSGDGVGLPQFESGKAAMAWGVDFGYQTIAGNSSFPIGNMPFPTVTKATTPVSVNAPAEYGLSVNGTSYMIPAKTTGKSLEAAILFLQYVTSPQGGKAWLAETGGIPSIASLPSPSTTASFAQGAWGKTPKVAAPPSLPPPSYDVAPGVTLLQAFEGYLLGTQSLSQEEAYLQNLWDQAAQYNVQYSGWGNQAWTKSLG
jgi:ABC-type glycerol-3-phosphate transport system substrate-binding protein